MAKDNSRGGRKKLSPTSVMHYSKLTFRSLLLVTALVLYIVNRLRDTGKVFGGVENDPVILIIVWLVFVTEMIFRFFPAGVESMGCRKQFRRNYRPAPSAPKGPPAGLHRGVAVTAAAWIALNSIFGILYHADVLDSGIMLLISLAYSVCDMVCILFFCPFQTWFMKNKCCSTCRIYNWDYAMMFTPLVFIPNWYCQTLAIIALVLLIQWEFLVFRHPERFSEASNCSLACANCTEKLCHHKTQLRRFLRREREQLRQMGHQIRSRTSGEK